MVDFAACSPAAVVDRDSWLKGLVEEEIVSLVGRAVAVLQSEYGEVVRESSCRGVDVSGASDNFPTSVKDDPEIDDELDGEADPADPPIVREADGVVDGVSSASEAVL